MLFAREYPALGTKKKEKREKWGNIQRLGGGNTVHLLLAKIFIYSVGVNRRFRIRNPHSSWL